MSTQRGNDFTWQPVWLRLQSKGNVFSAAQSSDGVDWFQLGESTVSMRNMADLTAVSATASKRSAGLFGQRRAGDGRG